MSFLRASRLISALLTCLTALPVQAQFWGFEEPGRMPFAGLVWESALPRFDDATYTAAVEAQFSAFERATKRPLAPGKHQRAGIKLYTNSGAGLHTPHGLTRGVIAALERRGFSRAQLFLLDARANRLRECGYLPPLSDRRAPQSFEGVAVIALDDERSYHPDWFYENPVPLEYTSALSREMLSAGVEEKPEDRKSPLPAKLILNTDFWINLPMLTDHPALGVNGALSNATLWNVGNRSRFFVSPANAPVAMAEIGAIPEMKAGLAITLLSLERYQYIAGPFFNSLYTRSEARLLGSTDPLILDALGLIRLNSGRKDDGFEDLGDTVPSLVAAAKLGLGRPLPNEAKIEKLEPLKGQNPGG